MGNIRLSVYSSSKTIYSYVEVVECKTWTCGIVILQYNKRALYDIYLTWTRDGAASI